MIYQVKIVIYQVDNIWMIYPVTDISMIYQPTIYNFYYDISAWYMISQICMIYLCMKFCHWDIKWDIIIFSEIYQKNRWYITKYHHEISISYISFLYTMIYRDSLLMYRDISVKYHQFKLIWSTWVKKSFRNISTFFHPYSIFFPPT